MSAVEIELPAAVSPERALLAAAGGRAPFFLDSALPMEGIGRGSILGWDPFLILSCKGDRVTVAEGREVRRERSDPFAVLRTLLERFRACGKDRLFPGAAVGYLGYDLCHFIERLPRKATDDVGMPDLFLAFHDTAVVWEGPNARARVVAVETGAAGRPPAAERAARVAAQLREKPPARVAGPARHGELRCNFADEDYRAAIRRCKDYIAAGDIFQVNLSRRFQGGLAVPPWELYLRLRAINPAPMAAYVACDDWAVVSASPELFLRLEDGRVETWPIKGTRRRSSDAVEDAALVRELLDSEKDGAELAMIVDLERNDLGRVCEYGSVRVTAPRQLQSFPSVHHLVARVEGRLRKDRDVVDLLRASFPGGSITGAPKIRAMEIIDELEPTCRGVYTGAIGMLPFDGGANLNIAIRTICVRNGTAYFQAGGGIVADSDPQLELEETLHKARALIRALDNA